jgi:hypothetical protein
MEEPPPPPALDPPILPPGDVAPPPLAPPPPVMAHFALVETAQLLDPAPASPLLGHVVASVPSPPQEKQSLMVCDSVIPV